MRVARAGSGMYSGALAPTRSWRGWLIRSVAVILLTVVVLATTGLIFLSAWLWHSQDRVVFQPPAPPFPDAEDARRIDFTAEDGQRLFAYLVGEPATV